MRVRRRLGTLAALLLLVLFLMPRPAAAGGRELSRPAKRASSTVSRLLAVLNLFPAQWIEKLGPEMDPAGLTGSNPPSPPPPSTNLGPGMDPFG